MDAQEGSHSELAPSEQQLPVNKGTRRRPWVLQGEDGKSSPEELTQPTGQSFVYHHPLTASSRREEVRKKKKRICPSPTSLGERKRNQLAHSEETGVQQKGSRGHSTRQPCDMPAGLVRLFIAASTE